MPSKYLILCHPLLLLPSVFPRIRVFFNELALHVMWPKYWSFSFSISPSNEYLGLISFRTDWFDLLVSKGRSNPHLLHLLHCGRLLYPLSHPLSGNKPSSDLRRTLGALVGGGGGDGEGKQRKRNETQGGASGGARMMSRPEWGRPCRERSGHAAPAGSGEPVSPESSFLPRTRHLAVRLPRCVESPDYSDFFTTSCPASSRPPTVHLLLRVHSCVNNAPYK